MSIRLIIIVEGQTEETFVNRVLKEHLATHDVFVAVCKITTSRKQHKCYRGGGDSYGFWKNDLERWIKQEKSAKTRFTTMIDLYGLHRYRDKFPGFTEAEKILDHYQRVACLEQNFARDINDTRFIPYIQVHEFEALILSDPGKFYWQFINHDEEIDQLIQLSSQFNSPEMINDGEETAPSKRIIKVIPGYAGRKPSAGPIIAEKIGLPTLRMKCPHFAQWLDCLEKLAQK